jgi:LuxR family transcriptional regulator, maltose regulon positive regulatory protein
MRKTGLVKLSRPRLHRAHPRERLFADLDASRERACIWIVGPPGAGKTTLAASYIDAYKLPAIWYQLDAGDSDTATFFYYLRDAAGSLARKRRTPLALFTPEYASDIAGFARRYFRDLYPRLPGGSLFVLDNYHELPLDSPLHVVLSIAVEEATEQITLMILSRTDPPQQYSRLLASERIASIDSKLLRLSFEESREIARLRLEVDDDLARSLHERSDGWAAGLTLMLEGVKRSTLSTGEVQAEAREVVFDYFAEQVFKAAAPATRELLIRTAFLGRVSEPAAQALRSHHTITFTLRGTSSIVKG